MTDTTTKYRTIAHTDVTQGLHARLTSGVWGPYYAIYTERGWYDLTDGQRIGTGEGTIIEVPVEPQPAPAPEPTDEQRAAVEWLRDTMNRQLERHAGILFEMLPSELTAPLPTEPGRYMDRTGSDDWVFDGSKWTQDGNEVVPNQARPFAPFRRLVPERPPVTGVDVYAAVRAVGGSLSPVSLNAIVQLANGTDQ